MPSILEVIQDTLTDTVFHSESPATVSLTQSIIDTPGFVPDRHTKTKIDSISRIWIDALQLENYQCVLGGDQRYQPQTVESEGDLTCYFLDEIWNPMKAAFRALGPSFRSYAQLTSPYDNGSLRIDFAVKVESFGLRNCFAALVELKKPGYIVRDQWLMKDGLNNHTRRLVKRIRR